MLLIACKAPDQEAKQAGTVMGTVYAQTIYGTEEGIQSARDLQGKLQVLEQVVLSRKTETSELWKVNASFMQGNKKPYQITAQLAEYLQQLIQISADSDGALDITLGAAAQLWNFDEQAGENSGQELIPSAEQIREVMSHTGMDKLQMTKGEDGLWYLQIPEGMQLDLGAAGKGIACDIACDFLMDKEGITSAVVSVGGSILVYGSKPDGSPWMVAVAHPREKNKKLGVLKLQGTHYISTSGDYERYFMAGEKRYHHILDPGTGYPADSGLCSVTIVCDSGLLSDALSTACFVLGQEKGMALAEKYHAMILMVDDQGTLFMNDSMKACFQVTND